MKLYYDIDDFRETFWTPFEQFRDRIGQQFTILGRDTEAEKELEAAGTPDILYRIRFEDGFETAAWGEEVCKTVELA